MNMPGGRGTGVAWVLEVHAEVCNIDTDAQVHVHSVCLLKTTT